MQKNRTKREILLVIAINAREKEVISERLPNVLIVRTMKQKSKRHRYYMEESRSAMRLLRELRKPMKGDARG